MEQFVTIYAKSLLNENDETNIKLVSEKLHAGLIRFVLIPLSAEAWSANDFKLGLDIRKVGNSPRISTMNSHVMDQLGNGLHQVILDIPKGRYELKMYSYGPEERFQKQAVEKGVIKHKKSLYWLNVGHIEVN